MRRLLFPVFNAGSALILFAYLMAMALVAATVSSDLALYMTVFGYGFGALNTWIMGLAPARTYIPPSVVHHVINEIDNSPNMVKVSDQCWAPKRHTSPLWKSDRICIFSSERDGAVKITGRIRALQAIVEGITEEGLELRSQRIT